MHNFVCSSILTVHHWKKNRTEKIAVFLYESIAVRNYTLCCPSNYSLGVFFLKTLLHNQLLIIPIVQNKSLSGVIRFLCNSLKLEIITLKKKTISRDGPFLFHGKGYFAREKNHYRSYSGGDGGVIKPV